MELKQAIANIRDYYNTGETMTYGFRKMQLEKLRDSLIAFKDEILDALKSDLNKSHFEGYMTEYSNVLSELDFALKNLKKWMRPKKVRTSMQLFPAKCFRYPEPYGVVLILSPWNYPFLLTIEPLIASIAAGNCALIKPSSYSSHTQKIIAKLIKNTFDEKFCTALEGSYSSQPDLLDYKYDYIFFTGSVNVGKTVMQAASKHLTPVCLELGGKSPVIVDETANIDLAAKRLAFGKFINCGQTCVAPDYVFVHESVFEKLKTALINYIDKFYPFKNGQIADYPSIISPRHFDKAVSLLEGQSVAYGGKHDKSRLFIQPTVVLNPEFDTPLMTEEIFAPILPIIKYKNLSEVVGFVTSRPKPLALYLFTSSKSVKQTVLSNVSFGGGCINDCIIHLASPYLPFGGVGESGMGSYHGKTGFETLTHYKSIVDKSARLDFESRYRPYTDKKQRFLRRMLK